ncbi:MAG: TonB-dependent receptor [Hyphomonadaceae bacterium]|nr:TonB-dependent receptor [Hyphomonadaceae bacterium]
MRYLSESALVAAAFLISLPAYGQESDNDIIVTATRLAGEAQRLPADVDVIDVDEARSRGIDTIAAALAEAPGLNVMQTGGFGQQTSLFSGGANSNHTLVLFDGLRLNDPASPGSSFDAGQDMLGGLSRIEIVQGPMSAVYGSDAIGGVVNILPRRGGEGPLNAQLEARGGSFNTLAATAIIDGTLGNFRYAITGEGYTTDGYDLVPERFATHTGDEDGADSSTFTGIFDLNVADQLTLDLLVRRRTARADFDAFNFESAFPFREFRADDPDLEITRNDLTVARLGATWRLSDAFTLRATGGASDQEREEQDGGFTTSAYDGERRFSDLTLNWKAGDTGVLSNAGIAVGLEAQTEEVNINQGFATVIAAQDHRGVFATAQADIANITLTGAVRADDFEGFGTEATWRAGASINVIEPIRIYAAYGTSFRAPTLYERFIFFGDPNLDPERGSAWEIGADARLAAFGQDNGVEFGLLYRSSEIEDLIDFNAFFSYANIDAASIDSVESRVAIRPASWLVGRVSYVYTDAEDASAGTHLLRRPESMWIASLDFERGPFSGQLAWRRVGERADQIYGSDSFYAGVGVTPEYDVLRASAAWDIAAGAQIYVAAENLTDATYEPVNGFAGAPRSIMVGVRLRPTS